MRETLLLVGRQGFAQAPHELARAHAHGRVGRALLVLLGHDDDVEARVRIARGAQSLDRARDVGLLVGGHEVQEDGRPGIALDGFLGRQRGTARVSDADES